MTQARLSAGAARAALLVKEILAGGLSPGDKTLIDLISIPVNPTGTCGQLPKNPRSGRYSGLGKPLWN
jgi:hypothetical protein